MKTVKQGFVYLTEIMDGVVRPALVLNVYGNHSVIIPLRGVMDLEVATGEYPEGDVPVQFVGNKSAYSVAQVGSCKPIPNKKIGRELGEMYDIDYANVVNVLIGRR